MIAMHQMAKEATSLAVEAMEKKERNILHVAQLLVPARKEARENLGERKQGKEKRNEQKLFNRMEEV